MDEIACYCRVSTEDQSLDRQLESTSQYAEREFDAVVIASVSRICRSISDLKRTAGRLEEAGVALHIVSEGLTLEPGE